MDTHVRVLGLLNVIAGIVGLLAAGIVLLVSGGLIGLMGLSSQQGRVPLSEAPLAGVLAGILVVITLALSVPSIIGGLGLLRYRSWARVMMTVVSAINILNVPIGSLLGVYGLWVLLSMETEFLFSRHYRIRRR